MPWNQLHWCAFRNDAQGIRKLTTPGTFCCRAAMDPDAPDQAGATPLHVACAHGQCHAVEALIDAGADPSAETKHIPDTNPDSDCAGETPLHWVVKMRYKPEDLHYVTSYREEAHSGHTICARHLLRAGADPNAQVVRSQLGTLRSSARARQKSTGRTALHGSVVNGFDEITRLLIYEFGADCNIEDKSGKTPKSLAGRSRLRDLMEQYEKSLEQTTSARKAPQTPPPRALQP